jgi:hypothetical protein
MEQGPGVPASRERGGKDERARAVVTPRRAQRQRCASPSAEGRLRRAGWRCGEDGFATVGNVANPRIGSGMKQARTVEEEQAVAVVRNHEDGTREGVAPLSEGRESVREWTLRLSSMEGRSLDNPKRGSPMVYPTVGPRGPGRRRARRHEGQEGRAPPHANGWMRTDRGSLEGRASRASVCPRPRRAVANANVATTSIGSSPRGRHPVGVVAGRGPCGIPRRRGGVEASAFTPACPVVRGRRLRRCKARRQTLETP